MAFITNITLSANKDLPQGHTEVVVEHHGISLTWQVNFDISPITLDEAMTHIQEKTALIVDNYLASREKYLGGNLVSFAGKKVGLVS